MNNPLIINANDLERLQAMLLEARAAGGKDTRYLDDLDGELKRAKTVPASEIPPDVITMHSRLRLRDLDTREEMVFKLEFPDAVAVNADAENISVLAPIGTALIGARVGDTIKWQVPAGMRRIKVLEILFQPEANERLAH